MVFFLLIKIMIIISVYWFELFSLVSDVAHGPVVFINTIYFFKKNYWAIADNVRLRVHVKHILIAYVVFQNSNSLKQNSKFILL